MTIARGMFQPCSGYVSTAYEVCFDLALDLFQLSLKVCFYRDQNMLRPCTKFGSTVVRGLFSTLLEVCFDRARVIF